MNQLLALLLLFASTALHASDTVREMRIVEQLKRTSIVGEWVELQAPGVQFAALRSDAVISQRKGAVILLHDMGDHLDQREVIYTLRRQLPESGWVLLSLQMPVGFLNTKAAEYQDFVAEAVPRIEAAVNYLKSAGLLNIVVIGHGLGGVMVTHYMAGQPATEIKAVVTIGMRLAEQDRVAELMLYEQLATIRLPLFDIYGSRDLPAVLSAAKRRLSAGREGAGPLFRQKEVMGADHQFRGMSQLLAVTIAKWMGRVAPGSEVAGR